jgi:ABC-type protease/lipase transport system fused ATPase/permease subunit
VEWGNKHSNALSQYLDSTDKSTNFASASKAVRQIIQVLMVASGAMLVLYAEASGGVIFAAAMIGSRALSPVEQIVANWRALKQGWETRTRLLARLEDIHVPVNRTPLPVPKGIITLQGLVYVSKPGTPPLVRAASAKIEAGDSVAIIGPSGAGKSTLARMIVGYLRPTSGLVMLDGQDIHAWDPTARGLHMGYMPQSVTFFQGKTVRENIARLRVDDPPELVVQAAQRAGVHDLMMRLPQGYDTVISPTEFTPSGGQAQLIALARAFYGDPRVVVLDEPNAALDQEGEALFHKALHRANKDGRTVIVVTQRPSVLQHVNKVMLMTAGRIKEFGNKEDVMGGGNVSTKPAEQDVARSAQIARQAKKQAETKGPAKAPAAKAGAGTPKAAAVEPKEPATVKPKAPAPETSKAAGMSKTDDKPKAGKKPISDADIEKLGKSVKVGVSKK